MRSARCDYAAYGVPARQHNSAMIYFGGGGSSMARDRVGVGDKGASAGWASC